MVKYENKTICLFHPFLPPYSYFFELKCIKMYCISVLQHTRPSLLQWMSCLLEQSWDWVTSSNKIFNNSGLYFFITALLTCTEKEFWEHVQTVLHAWKQFLAPSQGKIPLLPFNRFQDGNLIWELLMYSHFLKYNLNF